MNETILIVKPFTAASLTSLVGDVFDGRAPGGVGSGGSA